jgi:hypothetical protein
MSFFIRKSTLLLAFFLLSSVIFYICVGRHALAGDIDFQFYADSLSYERIYRDLNLNSLSDLVTFNANFLGPILILDLFNGSREWVLVFNLFILCLVVWIVRARLELNTSTFLLLFFLSPFTFSSLQSVNKEILSILCVSLVVAWSVRGHFAYLLFALLCSVLVRWQLSLFVVAVCLSLSGLNPLRRNRAIYIFLVLVFVSCVYPMVSGYFERVNEIADDGSLSGGGSGLYSLFNSLQQSGGYFLVFIPKALQAMYGMVFKVGDVFNPDAGMFYNRVIVMLHCVVAFLLFLYTVAKRRLRMSDDFVFIAMIYCVIFVLSPIYAPRYFYPVYFLLCLVNARAVASDSTIKPGLGEVVRP